MFTRHLKVVIVLALALAAAGCKTTPPHEDSVSIDSPRPPGELTFKLPGFNTLAELRAWYEPDALTRRIYLFEKGKMQAVVVVAEWGSGDSWDALYLYAPDGYTKQWVARALWDAETRGVQVTFNKETGMIHVRSGKGMIIFSANIESLAAPPSRDW